MRLKSYIKYLQSLEKKVGNVELIYATDDEGNWFHTVGYSPSIKQVYKTDLNSGSIDGLNVYNYDDTSEEGDTTVVCIN